MRLRVFWKKDCFAAHSFIASLNELSLLLGMVGLSGFRDWRALNKPAGGAMRQPGRATEFDAITVRVPWVEIVVMIHVTPQA